MSEKKILCIEMESPCVKCGSRNLCSICATIKRYNSWPTREQTIETIAKALCNMYYSACSECAFKDKPKDCKSLLKNSDFYEQGEAALNALLEEQK